MFDQTAIKRQHLKMKRYDVAISGCGPVGAMLSLLLAKGGLKVLVVEKELKVFNKPRAIVLDSEAMRILQFCGVAHQLGDSIKPHPGTDYIGLDGQLIKVFDPQPPPFQLGWPATLTFIQPILERLLRKRINTQKNIHLLLGSELVDVSDANKSVEIKVRDSSSKESKTFSAKYLIGCDGGNSVVRTAMNVGVEDLGVDEDWLVVDAYLIKETKLPPKFIQYCWPSRPATFVLGPRNVRRWEIKILPGEDLKDFERKEKVMEVLSNYVDVTALKIWRTATYKHRVTSSKKWKINNIFIAGDSAHRTPPFLGQGLCTGIRDVANLSWKILHTEKFGLNDKILNTYEKERKPHAKVVIKHAKEFGKIIGELNLERAKKRDAILRPQLISGKMETTRQKFIPDIKGNLLIQKSLKTKECRNGGTLFVQPRLRFPRGQEKLMDDVIPMSFLYISTGLNQQTWMDPYEIFWRKLGGIRIIIMKDAERKETTPKDIVITKEVGKIFSDWSSKMSCEAVLVRPDRYVFSTIHNQEDINAAIKKLRTIFSQKH